MPVIVRRGIWLLMIRALVAVAWATQRLPMRVDDLEDADVIPGELLVKFRLGSVGRWYNHQRAAGAMAARLL